MKCIRPSTRKYSSVLQEAKTLNSFYFENIKINTSIRNKQSFNTSSNIVSEFSLESNINTNSENDESDMNKRFDALTNDRLNEMKNRMISYLKETEEHLQEKYDKYIEYINGYILQREMKISKILEESNEVEEKEQKSKKNFVNYLDKNIFKQIEYIFEIHDNIKSVIEDQVNLLFGFLDEFELIFQRNPLEAFIDENADKIMQAWLFSKINFEKLNLSKLISNTKLSEIFKKYLCKQSDNKFCSINIGKKGKENFPIEKEFLQDNINILQKIKFFQLQADDFEQIFNAKFKSKSADRLKSIFISECNNLKKPEFFKLNYPSLEKLSINMSILNCNILTNPAMEKLRALKVIKINHCQLNDKNLNDFFVFLSQKKNLQKALTSLSFTNNNLTFINMKSILSQDGYFPNLIEFNLEKNNIYDFLSDNFKALPSLQLLNLASNNISSFLLFSTIKEKRKELKALVVFTNNLFVTNNKENNNEYRQYFINSISKCDYEIKTLSLSMMFNRFNCDTLSDIIFSSASKISLKKLNLSYCGLSTKALLSFLQTNFGLLSLKELNLSNNFIDNSFFEEYYMTNAIPAIKSEENIIRDVDKKDKEGFLLEQLIKIDLSNNKFELNSINDYEMFSKFILLHSKMRKVKMQNNKFESDFYVLWGDKEDNENRKSINNYMQSFIQKKIKIFFRENYGFTIIPEILDVVNYKDKSI